MRISRRSFEGVWMQPDLWLKGSPLLVVGVMQSLSSYFPKQLPEITEWEFKHCCLSSISLLICTTRSSQAARELVFFSSQRHLHRASYVHCCLLLRHIFLEVEALSSCKISAAQRITDCICHSHLESVQIMFCNFLFNWRERRCWSLFSLERNEKKMLLCVCAN